MMAIMAWMLGALFVFVSLLPVIAPKGLGSMGYVMIGLPLVLLLVVLPPLMKLAEEPTPENDATPDGCWKLGQFYFNPADPAMMVPKRAGLGYSLNFARGRSWAYLGLVLLLVLWPIALSFGLK
jgi:uncharacterized membrane protein